MHTPGPRTDIVYSNHGNAKTAVMHCVIPILYCNICTAGFSGSQLLGGLLLHTTRKIVTKSCHDKFTKFVTSCTYNHTLYDESTGEVVVLATTSGGLAPYGVDTFFLESSSTYDSSLAVGNFSFFTCVP